MIFLDSNKTNLFDAKSTRKIIGTWIVKLVENKNELSSKNLFINYKMEKTYRVLCLFILTSGLFRLNAASSLPNPHRNYTQTHNRITYSENKNNSTETSVELRRQSLLPSVQRAHQIRHYHHHQHPSKHNKPSAYHQSDDTAFYNRLPVNQRPSHSSNEHFFGTESILTAAGVTVHRKNMPRTTSTRAPNAEHHFQTHHRQQQQQLHSPTRLRPNSIATRTTKKHSTSEDDVTDNNGMLVPLRINNNNNNSYNNNNNNNNSNRNRNNSHRKKSVPATAAVAPVETVAYRAPQTKITPVRDICLIFNMPKHCGMRLSSNKANSIQSDSGNPFDTDSNALDALAAKNGDDETDLTLPTTDKSAFNERHLRSNKRSQRDGHSSRSTSNNLNYDEKNDNANDGRNNYRWRSAQQPTTKATALRESTLILNDVRIIFIRKTLAQSR